VTNLLTRPTRTESGCASVDDSEHDFDMQVLFVDAAHVTLRLHGDFDLAATDLFAAVIGHHIATGHRYVRLDLSGLTFLDCTGLRALVAMHQQLDASGGRLTLARVGARTARLLRLTLLDEVLETEPSAADAMPRRDSGRDGR
jgi:anti-anti-sigma factor